MKHSILFLILVFCNTVQCCLRTIDPDMTTVPPITKITTRYTTETTPATKNTESTTTVRGTTTASTTASSTTSSTMIITTTTDPRKCIADCTRVRSLLPKNPPAGVEGTKIMPVPDYDTIDGCGVATVTCTNDQGGMVTLVYWDSSITNTVPPRTTIMKLGSITVTAHCLERERLYYIKPEGGYGEVFRAFYCIQ